MNTEELKEEIEILNEDIKELKREYEELLEEAQHWRDCYEDLKEKNKKDENRIYELKGFVLQYIQEANELIEELDS